MDTKTEKIVSMELVQVTEVKNSAAMEKEGLLRGLRDLASQGVRVAEIFTDQHPAIGACLAKDHKDIFHGYDTWHVSKVLSQLGSFLCSLPVNKYNLSYIP